MPRARRLEAIEWTGTPAMQWVVPLVVGNGRESVETELSRLERWGRPRSVGKEPTKVRITGATPFGKQITWVIADLVFEDDQLLIRNTAGRRTQQQVTVTFRQYVEASVVRGPASKSKAGR
ncbi:hypothetical protein K8Z61_18555 [Nocardioides sp. TRM66260-LWL]|uniref:hypothetical protein n=1 Tax=Nocardioides sp. TRM66260-LWL TaxID=2874478 RepID=UPI001CC7ED2E|nr:hypothetical protein [Nocardioides sp. TRM66260-LWL]MBZ5736497.1 hypothetical protein [Nocardioides sp. TRM66260-LWL]